MSTAEHGMQGVEAGGRPLGIAGRLLGHSSSYGHGWAAWGPACTAALQSPNHTDICREHSVQSSCDRGAATGEALRQATGVLALGGVALIAGWQHPTAMCGSSTGLTAKKRIREQ